VGNGGGEEVMMEDEKGGDDVEVLPYIDTYYNLSIKTGLMLRHATTTTDCPLVIKCDDDVYLHPSRFHELITRAVPRYLPRDNSRGIYLGRFLTSQSPVRDPLSKWFISSQEYHHPSFPPYAEGPLYLLSSVVVDHLPYDIITLDDDDSSSTSRRMRRERVPSTYLMDQAHRSPLFRFEDVFMGEMISGLPLPYKPRYIDLPLLYRPANESDSTSLPEQGKVAVCGEGSDDDDPTTSSSSGSSSSIDGGGGSKKKHSSSSSSSSSNGSKTAPRKTSISSKSSSGTGSRPKRRYVALHDVSPRGMKTIHELVRRECPEAIKDT